MNVEFCTRTFFEPPVMRRPMPPPVIWMPSTISPFTFEITLPVPTMQVPATAQRNVSTPLERLLMLSLP